MISRDDVQKQITELKMVPPVVMQIINIISVPDFDMNKAADVISYDPALTANILKIVNSPYLGLVDKVKSIKEAMVIVGSKLLMNMVILTAAEMVAKAPAEGYDMDGAAMWKNSVASAIASFTLAEKKKIEGANLIFTAGMLRDIGKIVLGKFIGTKGAELVRLAQEKKMTFEETEKEVLGIDHAEVSAMTLEYWKFPVQLVETVKYHHKPEAAPEDSPDLKSIYCVHLADAICIKCGIGAGRDGMFYNMSQKAVSALDIKQKDMEEAAAVTLMEFQKIEKEIMK